MHTQIIHNKRNAKHAAASSRTQTVPIVALNRFQRGGFWAFLNVPPLVLDN